MASSIEIDRVIRRVYEPLIAEPDHWTERGRAASVSNSDVTDRPRRSVPPLGNTRINVGNIAKLVLLDEERSPFRACPVLREAKNSIPIFWFALFSASDGHSFELPLSDGSSLSVPGLCAPLRAAVQRLSTRLVLIQSWLPRELQPLLAEFRKEVESQAAPRIGLNPAELALLHETEEDLQNWLGESTGVFENPEPNALAGLFDVTGLEFDVSAGRVARWDDRLVEVTPCEDTDDPAQRLHYSGQCDCASVDLLLNGPPPLSFCVGREETRVDTRRVDSARLGCSICFSPDQNSPGDCRHRSFAGSRR